MVSICWFSPLQWDQDLQTQKKKGKLGMMANDGVFQSGRIQEMRILDQLTDNYEGCSQRSKGHPH